MIENHPKMILNIAKTDMFGAGIATRMVNDILNNHGYISTLVVKESLWESEKVKRFEKYPKKNTIQFYFKIGLQVIEKTLLKLAHGVADSKYCFNNIDDRETCYTSKQILSKISYTPDIILLHSISEFINTETIYNLQKDTNARVFWLMMDNAPITGGCHYPWNCIEFHTDCAICPALKSNPKHRNAARNLSLKKKYLPQNFEVIAFSECDFERLNNSSLFKNCKKHKTLLPIDKEKYNQGDVLLARNTFNIPTSKKVIMCGSISLKEERKGFDLFIEALMLLQNKIEINNLEINDYLILITGKKNNTIYEKLKIPVLHTGYLNEETLIKAYQAADVFVNSSLEDSGPLMINQAIMCGTPIVSFETGVAIDLVKNNETGFLVKKRDITNMVEKIFHLLNLSKEIQQEMKLKCRLTGVKYSSNEAFIKYFSDIVD